MYTIKKEGKKIAIQNQKSLLTLSPSQSFKFFLLLLLSPLNFFIHKKVIFLKDKKRGIYVFLPPTRLLSHHPCRNVRGKIE